MQPTSATEAFERVVAWMDRTRSKDERWEFVNDATGSVENYGIVNGSRLWCIGVTQPGYHDSYLWGRGVTPDAAVIALAEAVRTHEENDDGDTDAA